jgi:hypothetical protein
VKRALPAHRPTTNASRSLCGAAFGLPSATIAIVTALRIEARTALSSWPAQLHWPRHSSLIAVATASASARPRPRQLTPLTSEPPLVPATRVDWSTRPKSWKACRTPTKKIPRKPLPENARPVSAARGASGPPAAVAVAAGVAATTTSSDAALATASAITRTAGRALAIVIVFWRRSLYACVSPPVYVRVSAFA